MKRTIGLVVTIAALFGSGFNEWARAGAKPVDVVVTNYTSAQPFSPPVCVVSDGTFPIYELGQPASAGLESIAEDAITSDLQALVDATEGATLVMGDDVILPGHSGTIVVQMDKKDVVSCVWMLVRTNDTFASITNVPRPKRRERLWFPSNALDAGTEVNDEMKANIPGFGDTERKGQDEEGGVVLGSTGIAGTGDLDNTYDWRGNVAAVTVERQ